MDLEAPIDNDNQIVKYIIQANRIQNYCKDWTYLFMDSDDDTTTFTTIEIAKMLQIEEKRGQ